MNGSIKKILRSIDKNLMIIEVSYETLQKRKILIVAAALFPVPCICGNCGSAMVDGNRKLMVVKNKEKEIIVHFE